MKITFRHLSSIFLLVISFTVAPTSAASPSDDASIEQLTKGYKETLDILNGNAPADLIIQNIKILDVYTNSVIPGSLLINKGKIIALNPGAQLKFRKAFDGMGNYAIPGFIDAHFHIKSQMATPAAMQDILTPHGTTTVFAEINDLVSAAQENGVEAAKDVFKDYEKFSYRLFILAPGKKVDAAISIALFDWAPVIGLGELNHNLLLAGDEKEFLKLATAHSRGMIVDGHVDSNRSSDQLNFFPDVGTSNNHNVLTYDAAVASLRLGLPTVARDMLGSLEAIIPGVVSNDLPTDNLLLGTDNRSVSTLVQEGHMDAIVQKVIGMGIKPIDAIKMASYNVARSFRMDDELGSLTPGRFADIILLKSLDRIEPLFVFKGGEIVAENGRMAANKSVQVDYSPLMASPPMGLADLKEQDLAIVPLETSSDGRSAKFWVWNQSFGDKNVFTEQWLPIRHGRAVPEWQGKKLSRISIIQRYPTSGSRKILNAYVVGYGLEQGAIGMNMAAPSPYIGVIGATDQDLFFTAKQLDAHAGGFMTTSNRNIISMLDLPIFGMMTIIKAKDIVVSQENLSKSGQELGYSDDMPWFRKMSYLFFSLDRHGKIK